MRLIKLLTFVTVMFSFSLAACEKSNMKEELAYLNSNNKTGLTALVSKEGKILCAASVGMANIELSVPLKTHHIFEIGSLTKQFTAVAILLLEQEGKLSRTDPISKYIQGIESDKGVVKIEHLLSHTSGLVDPINEPDFLATRIQEAVSFDDLLEQFKNGYWQYSPGERGAYSNVGYSMLSYIIEKVSGKRYIEFLKERIFNPLNMKQSDQASFFITPHKASGYTFEGQRARQHDFLNLNWAYGAGDLLSNTADLNTFTHALMGGKILNNTQLDVLTNSYEMADGTVVQSAYNYSFQTVRGARILRSSGSTLGFSSHSIYVPDENLYIVVLNNSDGVNGGNWVRPATVAGKLLANYLNMDLPDFTEIALTSEHAKTAEGHYQQNEQTIRKLSYANGQLYYQRNDGPLSPIFPFGADRYYFKDTLNYIEIKNAGTSEQTMEFYYLLNDEPEKSRLLNAELPAERSR